MATTLGTLLIELKAKTDQFEKGMKSAKDLSFSTTSEIMGSLGKIGSQLTNLRFNGVQQAGKSLALLGGIAGGVGVALATSMIAVAIKTSDKIVELGHDAEKAGMSIKEFTENAYAAKRSGVPIEDFTNSMAKLAKTALSAAEGNTQAQRAFKLSGTSATDNSNRLRSTGDILNDIIKKFDSLTDKTLKAGLAQQLFGRGGAAMLPFLVKGSEEIAALRKQAELLGVALDENTLASAKKFKGAIAEIKASAEGAGIQLTAGLVPALNDVLGALTKVEGKSSAMRAFGEEAGEGFKILAEGVAVALVSLKEFYLAAVKSPYKVAENMPTWQKMIPGVAAGKMLFQTDPGVQKEIDSLHASYDAFIAKLRNPAPTPTIKPEGKGVGTDIGGDGKFRKDVGDKEIEQLREKAQATLALAAAELQGVQSVRATTVANEADAIILKIATKAAEERARIETEGGKKSVDRAQILKEEIEATQKKYGATALVLTSLTEEAKRNESLNKSVVDQTKELGISADAHKRMAMAVLHGGDAVQQAIIANQLDALVRNADIELTKEQIAAIERLREAKQKDANAAVNESLAQENRGLQNAARATQLLTAALGKGSEAEIQARAAIEAKTIADRENLAVTDERIKKTQEQIAANMRAARNQQVGGDLINTYDPQAKYKMRIEEINEAVKNNANLTVYAEASKRDAYRQEQEELDSLAMKTQKGAAGAQVALREWLRNTKDWAKTTHESVTMVLQGFDSGFRDAFSDIIMGTKSVGQAFADMGRSMLRSVVDALANMVAKWIETKIIMAAMKLFGIDVGDDPNKKAAKQIAANVAEAESYAGLSAAVEFASALAQSAGNIPYAAGMASVALALGEGFAAMAAFDNGGIMPRTGIALVHQDEGVLTAPVTRMLKSMSNIVNSGGMGGMQPAMAGGSSVRSMAPFSPTFNIHGATDPDEVANKVFSKVKTYFRSGGVHQ